MARPRCFSLVSSLMLKAASRSEMPKPKLLSDGHVKSVTRLLLKARVSGLIAFSAKRTTLE